MITIEEKLKLITNTKCFIFKRSFEDLYCYYKENGQMYFSEGLEMLSVMTIELYLKEICKVLYCLNDNKTKIEEIRNDKHNIDKILQRIKDVEPPKSNPDSFLKIRDKTFELMGIDKDTDFKNQYEYHSHKYSILLQRLDEIRKNPCTDTKFFDDLYNNNGDINKLREIFKVRFDKSTELICKSNSQNIEDLTIELQIVQMYTKVLHIFNKYSRDKNNLKNEYDSKLTHYKNKLKNPEEIENSFLMARKVFFENALNWFVEYEKINNSTDIVDCINDTQIILNEYFLSEYSRTNTCYKIEMFTIDNNGNKTTCNLRLHHLNDIRYTHADKTPYSGTCLPIEDYENKRMFIHNLDDALQYVLGC